MLRAAAATPWKHTADTSKQLMHLTATKEKEKGEEKLV
jgi:hypothetical protein